MIELVLIYNLLKLATILFLPRGFLLASNVSFFVRIMRILDDVNLNRC